MEHAAAGPEAFTHLRILVGMVLGLSVTRLLSGLAEFVQHPGRLRPYWVHIGWAVLMLLAIVHFWWFEFGLSAIPVWTFRRFVFILGFAALHFFISAVLFPDDLEDHDGYRSYFLARRQWFFALLAGLVAVDTVDTLLKGAEHIRALGPTLWLRQGSFFGVCIFGYTTERFQTALVISALLCQLVWIFWRYNFLT
jgi:hypothetical protein